MRAAVKRLGADPKRINPLVPVDLVVDHSVQVDVFGSPDALRRNAEIEFERNRERYEFLRWGQKAFASFRVVPPATGIVHQVNLEYLAKGVLLKAEGGESIAMPDTLVGTDSHTTMINGLGVLGWGVGGIEAEAAMLGQPLYMVTPQVVGFRLVGRLREGTTATDLVLTVTQMLRKKGVVEKFVEFYGPGLAQMSLADRATIANMAPEYGATIGFFPVDDETLRYLRLTGRPEAVVSLVEAILEDPKPILIAQQKRAQAEVLARRKADDLFEDVLGGHQPVDLGAGIGDQAQRKSESPQPRQDHPVRQQHQPRRRERRAEDQQRRRQLAHQSGVEQHHHRQRHPHPRQHQLHQF